VIRFILTTILCACIGASALTKPPARKAPHASPKKVQHGTNQFCNPNYVSAPGEVMQVIKCAPTVHCDDMVLGEARRSCNVIL
jgi:hypothetical protein